MATTTILRNVKQGEYFQLANSQNSPIYVRDHYDRSSKRYCCHRYDDVCRERFFKPTLEVILL